MEFNFKKFEGTNVKSESRITITKSNSFGFPSKFFNDNKINDFRYVVVCYDVDNKVIGLHFTNDENEKNKYTIIKSKIGYGGSVIARSFFKAHNIDTTVYRNRYKWNIVEHESYGKLFVIELDNPKLENKDMK
jgi:hypothetical protein